MQDPPTPRLSQVLSQPATPLSASGTGIYVRSLWFKTNDGLTHYIPVSLMMYRVDLLKRIFTLPQAPDSTEGQTEDNAVNVHMLDGAQLAAIVDYFWDRRGALTGNMPALRLLLHMGEVWDCAEISRFAKDELPNCQDWSLALQFTLGARYHVETWVTEAFRYFLWKRRGELTEAERTELGVTNLLRLDKAYDEILDYRASIAFRPLPFESGAECTGSISCRVNWYEMWSNMGPRLLFHPRDSIVLASILPALQDPAGRESLGSCDGCFEATVQSCITGQVFEKEEMIIADYLRLY
ncbi:unnamed protein product [Peniophora sp. CBMAI 1063]|nr:unnamed protein product [Peniophora sp. CBMAI 1063]